MFACVDPPASCPPRALLERMRALDAELHRVELALAETILEAQRTAAYTDDGHASLLAWCRAANRWSTAESRRRIRVARLLEEHPTLAEAFRSGRIAILQTDVLARAAANPRCGHRIAEPMPTFLQFAPRLSHREFESLVQRWMRFVDPDGAHREEHEIHDARRARLHTDDDGTILLEAEGGGLQGALIRTVFEQYAQREFEADWAECVREHGDAACGERMRRTERQRRFDALHRVFLDAASRPSDARTPEPLVNLIVDVRTLARHLGADVGDLLREPTRDPETTRCACHLAGSDQADEADEMVTLARARVARLCRRPNEPGPARPGREASSHELTPRTLDPPDPRVLRAAPAPARMDAASSGTDADLRWLRSETTDGHHVPTSDIVRAMIIGQVRRVVVDSAGVIIDLGRRRRLFTGGARDAVLLASTRCLWPGCERPSSTCQADHLIDWQHHGATHAANGGPLCGRHNRVKNLGFTVERDPHGCWRVARPDGTEL